MDLKSSGSVWADGAAAVFLAALFAFGSDGTAQAEASDRTTVLSFCGFAGGVSTTGIAFV